MRLSPRFGLAAVLVSGSLFAQVKETVNVNVVEVPVTVVDRSGDPVRGLTAANFELIDSGTRRDITSFDAIDFASQAASSASPLNPAARRTFVLLFDLSFSKPATLERAQAAARHFIARNVQRRDLVSIASVDADKGFRVLTSFTTDRNLVAAAISDPHYFQGNDPLQIAGLSLSDQVTPARAGIDQEPVGRDSEQQYELKRMQDKQDLEFRRHKIELQLGALEGLAKTLRNVPGRKEVVLLSEGFDPSVLRGRDVRATAEQQQEADEVFQGNLWRVISEERYGSASGMAALGRMAKAFRGADVVLNAIDIRGVRVQNDVEGATINSNEGLYLLAQPTGGIVVDNFNDLTTQFSRMMHAQEVVYVLSFKAPTKNAGKFHDLKVKLVGVPGARAFHRAGYYEMGSQNAVERTLSTAQIVVNDLPQSDIRVGVIAAAFPTGGAKSMVPVVLEIDGADLMRDVHRDSVVIDIFVYAFDEEGNVRDTLFQKIQLDLRKVGDKLRASGVKYYGTLSLPAGKYAIRSLVREAGTESKGYTRTDMVVPAASDVALLPPLFPDLDVQRWIVVRGTEHDKSAFPFTISSEPFLPTLRVAGGAHRRFTVFAWNAAAEEVTWETSPAATLVLQERDAETDMVKAVFQLDSVGPTLSHVNVTLHRKGSAEVRTASVPIVVLK